MKPSQTFTIPEPYRSLRCGAFLLPVRPTAGVRFSLIESSNYHTFVEPINRRPESVRFGAVSPERPTGPKKGCFPAIPAKESGVRARSGCEVACRNANFGVGGIRFHGPRSRTSYRGSLGRCFRGAMLWTLVTWPIHFSRLIIAE